MPQVFQVLRCYKCFVFQVHQTKKSNKFQCKMCGEKQTIKRHYGLGNGQECRVHVQKLNGLRGVIDENSSSNEPNKGEEELKNIEQLKDNSMQDPKKMITSKWSAFIEQNSEQATKNNDETMYLNDAEFVLETPKKCRNLTSRNTPIVNIGTSTKISVNASIDIDFKFENSWDTYKETKSLQLVSEEKSNTYHQKPYKDVKETDKENKKGKGFIPPTVNVNSKWAQYTENSVSHNEEVVSLIKAPLPFNHSIEKQELLEINNAVPKNLFSLCDEDNLDSVLDL